MERKKQPETGRDIGRRTFLKGSVRGVTGAALGAVAMTALSSKRVMGANERVNVALIGGGGRGRMVARSMTEHGVEVTWVCDVHDGHAAQSGEMIAEGQDGRIPKTTRRIREVLDAKDVDAVVIATPDHWHAPATILACQAGKDVYVEKPNSHNIWESQKMIEAARKYDRIVQVGTQSRSAEYAKAARQYIAEGNLGEIPLVKTYNLKPGGPVTIGPPGEPSPDFDWDVWLGAAPERPCHRGIYNHGWLFLWDFCGGDTGNDGIHQMDLTMMALGDPGLPKAVTSTGGNLAYPNDDRETPDVQITAFDFDDFVMTFEMTNYPPYMEKTTTTIRRKDLFPYWTQNATRIELYGTKYMMTLGRHGGGWQVTGPGGKVHEQMYGRFPDEAHQDDFVNAVKTRCTPSADIAIAHTGCTMVHLANIAYRLGRTKLAFDPETQRFIDNDAANALLKRTYRKGYEVPENV